MNSFKFIRNLHKWPGILFLFPAFLISISTILLAMDNFLHLDDIKINVPSTTLKYKNIEVKAVCFTDTKQFIGTKTGLIIVEEDTCYSVSELAGCDIKSMLVINDAVFIASKQGLWKFQNKIITKIYNKEIHSISQFDNSIIVSLGKKGFEILDFNGRMKSNEKKYAKIEKELAQFAIQQPISLRKLVIALHTGEAIVGKNLEPYWIAFCGTQLLLLTATGCWFIFKKKKKQEKVLKN